MMRRLLLTIGLLLSSASPLFAQAGVWPAGITPPVFIVPAPTSATNFSITSSDGLTGLQLGKDGAVCWSSTTAPDVSGTNDDICIKRGSLGNIKFTNGGAGGYWIIGTGGIQAVTDNAIDIGTSTATRPRSLFVAAPAITVGSGTGITVNDGGELRTLVYKVTVASTQFISAAVNHDVTLATLPAKTFIAHILADVTQTFACTATCTSSTLSATVGSAAGGTQFLLSFDVDAATGQFGDAAGELGASLTEATIATAIGTLGSWSSTTPVSMRLISGTGNLGNGVATNLSQGSITFYIFTTVMP